MFWQRARHRAIDATRTEGPEFVRRTAAKARGDWRPVPARENPGVRVAPDFVTEDEASAVVSELDDVLRVYGASHVTDPTFYSKQMAYLGATVNMRRATGRPELATQRECPWGYGDRFDASKLPATVRHVADKVKAENNVGPLRDVTVNARDHSFYRLDAHVDPLDDGPNVFILGFATTVLTLSPVGPPLSTLADQRTVALESWAPADDIDIFARRLSLVHLADAARSKWNHGIRPGLNADHLRALDVDVGDADGIVFDWFGAPSHPIPRAPSRLSLVFAFADS